MSGNSGEDIRKAIEERLEAQLARKREFIRRQARKSFVLDPSNFDNESDLKSFLVDQRKEQIIERHRKEERTLSAWNFKYLVSRNAPLAAHLIIELNSLILSQSFFTLRTRSQAHSKVADIAHYVKNRVETLSLLKGLSHSYALCLLHFSVFVNAQRLIEASGYTGKWSFECQSYLSYLFTDFATLPFKCALEVRRALTQMGHTSISFGETMFKTRQSIGALALRDFVFRTMVYVSLPEEDWRKNNTYRLADMTKALIITIFVSNPLDVVCTKMYTQQIEHYTSILGTLKTVYREETLGKLMSGFAARFGAMLAPATIQYLIYARLRAGIEGTLSKDALL